MGCFFYEKQCRLLRLLDELCNCYKECILDVIDFEYGR